MFFCAVLSDKRVVRPARGREKNNIAHTVYSNERDGVIDFVAGTLSVGQWLIWCPSFGTGRRKIPKRPIEICLGWRCFSVISREGAVRRKPSVFSSFHDRFLGDTSRRFFGSGPRCPKHSSPTPSDRWRCRRRRSLFSALSLDIPPPPSTLVHLSIACTFTRIVIVGCRQRFGHTGRVRERYSRFCFLGRSCFCPIGFFSFLP